VIISNTLWVGESVPCLTYGMRGMVALSIEVSGPERDVHSGNDGGVFEEPMADLVRVRVFVLGGRSSVFGGGCMGGAG
jgi:di- and tripeptidase/Cys-Gly metallodipeptidase DUG1